MIFRRTASVVLASGVVAGSVVMGAAPALADHEGSLFVVNINNTMFETPRTSPSTILRSAPITGLQGGETLVGIDFRPKDGEIYGITDQSRVYRIEYRPSGGIGSFATATRISTLSLAKTDGTPSPSPVSLTGVNFGVNFDPVADRLRVVSQDGQNLRINVDTGATMVDGNLAYAADDANKGQQAGVTAVAYTNPDNDPTTGTELFDIDATPQDDGVTTNFMDVISKQDPPDSGTLRTRGTTGRDSSTLVGYDIDTDNFGVAALNAASARLVSIVFDNNPTTDDAPTVTTLGLFPVSVGQLRSLALGIPDPDGLPGSGPTPVVPEFPLAALAPVLGLGLAGAMLVVRRRREV